MKSSWLVIASFALQLLAAGGARAGTLTVTAPNGGEKWPKGSTKNITWSYSGNDWQGKAVRIVLWKAGASLFPIVDSSAPLPLTGQAGSYAWKVGTDYQGAPAAGVGDDYSVRVRIEGTDTMDNSNAVFSITQSQVHVKPAALSEYMAPLLVKKPNLRIAVALTPAACKSKSTTTCGPPTWISFPVTVSNVGEGKGTVNGTLSWRLYLYYWGQDGNQNPGSNWNAQWWSAIGVPAAGASVAYTTASGSTGTTGGNQLTGHDFGLGKWVLRAEVDLPPGGNAVAETDENDNFAQVEFWVK